ncbi:polycomb group protein ASXL1 [Gastrophryne carolinensis]
MRDKQKRRRERTWAEAAKMVLENYSDAPMTPKQILNVIEAEGLKDTNGSSPLACLNAMLHSNSRTREALFYKLPGRISLFTMKKNAVQWSRGLPVPEDGDAQDTADDESSQWIEGSTVTTVESSGNDSSPQEPCVRETRSLVQGNMQKRRSGVLLPRVVLTPLKVNGAHLPSTSGLPVRHIEGATSTSRTLSRSLTFHRRATLAGNSTHHLRSVTSQPVTGQVKKSKEEDIDFETPGSILVNTNLRALINVRTFNALPSSLQQQLLHLLPEVDRQVTPDGQTKMSSSALNNEFFAHACLRWRERLADGEFTPEAQMRMRQEMGKEKKVEDWKEKFFEDFYGQRLGLCEDPGSDPEDKCGQLEGTYEALQRTIPEPIHAEEPLPEIQVRTRRSIYRNRERLQRTPPAAASTVTATQPPARAEAVVPPPEDRLSPADAGSLPSTSDRVPALHPETSDQKRKIGEPEGSSPSVEKKPRMEQRQSFRNTIASVHPEKPQPTKEEPKVPPIRIQLSRIKPPWVVKGLPAYQICPRIIPNSDPPGCKPPSCSAADSQAGSCDLQISIGGGGGPGGGHRAADRRSWSSDSKRRRRSAKRRHRKKPTNCCRTQLLSAAAVRDSAEPPHLPRVKITCTKSSPECKDLSPPGAVAKEWHVSEVVTPIAITGAPSRGTSPDKASNKDKPIGDKGEENLKVVSSASTLVRDLVQGSSGHPAEVPSSVLGDVSNTFQNRVKSVVASLVDKEKTIEGVVVSSNDVANVDFSSGETSQATPTFNKPQVAESPEDLSLSAVNLLDLESENISSILDVREPVASDLQDSGVQNQMCKTGSAFKACHASRGLQMDVTSEPQAKDSLSPGECLTVSLPSNNSLQEEKSKCSTLISKDADLLTFDGSVISCSPPSILPESPGKGFAIEETTVKCEGQIPPGSELPTATGLHHKERLQDGSRKSASFPTSHVDSTGKDPTFLDVSFAPFSKEVCVELPMDLLPPPSRMKQTLFAKLLKQARDVASYCYSAGGQISPLLGEYALTGRASLSLEVLTNRESGEHVSLRCSCSFKAMTVCEGCGAFCHIDCIGPSKLCVSCLVIR